MPRIKVPAGHKPCVSCKGSHPVDGPPIPAGRRPFTVDVDGLTLTVTKSERYGNHWEFPHPHGGRGLVILFTVFTLDFLVCSIRRDIREGVYGAADHGPAELWQDVESVGRGLGERPDDDAGRLRRTRSAKARERVYAATGMERGQLETTHSTFFGYSGYRDGETGDPYGRNSLAVLFLEAYAGVLAEAEAAGEPIYPVERHALAYRALAVPGDRVAAVGVPSDPALVGAVTGWEEEPGGRRVWVRWDDGTTQDIGRSWLVVIGRAEPFLSAWSTV